MRRKEHKYLCKGLIMFIEGGCGAIEECVGRNSTDDTACPITSIEFRNRLNTTAGDAAKWVKNTRHSHTGNNRRVFRG